MNYAWLIPESGFTGERTLESDYTATICMLNVTRPHPLCASAYPLKSITVMLQWSGTVNRPFLLYINSKVRYIYL